MTKTLHAPSAALGAALAVIAMLSIGAATKSSDASRPAAAPDSVERVTGIGGVFFKARDPKAVAAWYRAHLGIRSRGGFADFVWRESAHPERTGHTAWALFPDTTSYFGSSKSPLMINYRVANLDRLLAQLRSEGVTVEKTEDFDYGRFAWITDPEGNRIELWEQKGD